MDEFDFREKTVIVRVDLNTHYNIAKKRIDDSPRMGEHANTINELIKKKSRIVLLAHQGRRGDNDFIHLNQHAKLLSKYLSKKAQFVNDVIGKKAIKSIKNLKPGYVLLLDNVRFLDEETNEKDARQHSKGRLVRALAPLADAYVNDAFSVSHRSHASIVGFTPVLPSFAGRLMQKEVSSLNKIFKSHIPVLYVLAGAKPDDCLKIMDKLTKRKKDVKMFLTCGVLGELFLIAKGYDLGRPTLNFLKKKGHLKNMNLVKRLLKVFGSKIQTPEDVAVDVNGRKELSLDKLPVKGIMMDIGKLTVRRYSEIIKNSRSTVAKGPASVYEKKRFAYGTKKLFVAIANSKGYRIVGGGDSSIALDKLKINRKRFSYVSLGGGAFIKYLTEKDIPGVRALK